MYFFWMCDNYAFSHTAISPWFSTTFLYFEYMGFVLTVHGSCTCDTKALYPIALIVMNLHITTFYPIPTAEKNRKVFSSRLISLSRAIRN